jgi:hypothetical protein
MMQFIMDLCHGQSYAVIEILRLLYCALLPLFFVYFKDS